MNSFHIIQSYFF